MQKIQLVLGASRLAKIRSIALIVFGTLVLAFGNAVFILPFNLIAGGVGGISIILHSLFSSVSFLSEVSTEIYIIVINTFLFFVGLFTLGRSFAFKTLISAVLYPPALLLASRLLTLSGIGEILNLGSEMYAEFGGVALLLSAIFGGALVGVGCALTFLGGGSTGGTDVIAFLICKLPFKIKSSTAVFMTDATIVLVGVFVMRNLIVSMLGITCALIMAVMIDKVFIGESGAYVANIVTEQHERINAEIVKTLDRTTTLVDAVGGYTGKKKKMLTVTFSVRQYAQFSAIISAIDKKAFVIIQKAHSIGGAGWTYAKDRTQKKREDGALDAKTDGNG